jgi:hypothetical protein
MRVVQFLLSVAVAGWIYFGAHALAPGLFGPVGSFLDLSAPTLHDPFEAMFCLEARKAPAYAAEGQLCLGSDAGFKICGSPEAIDREVAKCR